MFYINKKDCKYGGFFVKMMLIARNYEIKNEQFNLLEDILIKYFIKDLQLELNNNDNINY